MIVVSAAPVIFKGYTDKAELFIHPNSSLSAQSIIFCVEDPGNQFADTPPPNFDHTCTSLISIKDSLPGGVMFDEYVSPRVHFR